MGWIGVDLDGTLAEYHGWLDKTVIGTPVKRMVNRVKKWLAEGKDVRIVTARAGGRKPEVLQAITDWCLEHIGQALPITNEKDYDMVELWDDRAVQVITNTGDAVHEYLDPVVLNHIKVCGRVVVKAINSFRKMEGFHEKDND